jgi:predicted RNA binding protein YcfA (HicA-like mRNA interferase family)
MFNLNNVPGKATLKAFEKLGFRVVRIRGAHHIMKKPGHRYLLSVPVHGNKPVAPGTLRTLIAGAGATEDEFLKLL